jgi:hypothetical protein
VATGHTFSLRRPHVVPQAEVGAAGDVRVLTTIDDRPVAVDIRFQV